jgi:hypothetical protein
MTGAEGSLRGRTTKEVQDMEKITERMLNDLRKLAARGPDDLTQEEEEAEIAKNWEEAVHPEHMYLFADKEQLMFVYAQDEESARAFALHSLKEEDHVPGEMRDLETLEAVLKRALELVTERRKEIADHLAWREAPRAVKVPFEWLKGIMTEDDHRHAAQEMDEWKVPFLFYMSSVCSDSPKDFYRGKSETAKRLMDKYLPDLVREPGVRDGAAWVPVAEWLWDVARRDRYSAFAAPIANLCYHLDEDETSED